MTVAVLLMLIGGVALAQGVSDPRAVTLRWLRLGGIIAVTLMAVAMVVWGFSDRDPTERRIWFALGVTFLVVMGQLMTVQLGWRGTQRAFAAGSFMLTCALAAALLAEQFADLPRDEGERRELLVALALSTPAAAGLLGGTLLTMLLGHAYLTAGNDMTQAPFRRLTLMLAALLALRLVASLVFGVAPYLNADIYGQSRSWNLMLITARYAVGLVVPAVFTYMILDCVHRRANQSATGILYVMIVLIVIGEGLALALVRATGQVF